MGFTIAGGAKKNYIPPMSWKVLAGLMLCNAIWATNPVMGKILMRSYLPMQVSWMRYGSALLGTLLAMGYLWRKKPALMGNLSQLKNFSAWGWLLAIGLITFFGSATLQYLGLNLSTSTANALIVAVEPLFAVILARVFLGETMRLNQVGAFILALLGFFLLSNIKPGDILGSMALFNFGNLLLLLVMPMEAMYSIGSRKLAGRVEPIPFFGLSLPIGFAALTAYLLVNEISLPTLSNLDGQGAFALLWLGPVGTAASYVFWTVALVSAPVAAVSLTLFAQPILGAIFGMTFLGERLDFWQFIGAALILSALVLQTLLSKPEKA
jgi:drug/metabolite transporter (DMT)-like permease